MRPPGASRELPSCARTVRNRRELDRTIGRVMRTVAIPRGAQQRLLAHKSRNSRRPDESP